MPSHGEDVNGTANGTTTEKPKSPSSNKSSDEEYGFEHVSSKETVPYCPFSDLMALLRKSQYDKNADKGNVINEKCKELFERDYKIKTVTIDDACMNYPKEILVPVSPKEDEEANPMGFNAELYRGLVSESKLARLRSRFVAPVILFDNKYICRSGALCVWTSALYEHIKGSMPSMPSIFDFAWSLANPASLWYVTTSICSSVEILMSDETLRQQYGTDVKILEHLKVDRICDLMVEYKKNFKGYMYVSSTEKVNEEFYKDIKIEEMPYPGCEFFTKYFEAEKIPDGLVFDWKQADVTRTLTLTENPTCFSDMDIQSFEEWDLVRLTQNYLKIILSHLLTGNGGMLVHCISGWDRTPLFVSLIRLSLWADGVVHTSLKYEDMAFLTVAYDWYLFGHNLPDRLRKNEEVMHFCFNFLQHITSDEFSITRMFEELDPEIKRDRIFPQFVRGQRGVLNDIRNYVMDSCSVNIPEPENE